ncbi:hypothetical protein A3D78_07645 [Candidatus Gottesmanbacteria bacterium RIFCSPHIGHO2_02_FULL_39_14]|uniref:OBG-type G domain-containing protein n=2 Tax=Candidatus Gottesmaniibacteriota TaxID=1752720 RepID=A0A1F5ZVY1_9BACT|nr:MAG: hypothetical protein A2153_01190 [Candidatus Gottesmanbacteria bacterium RBG_16_38_7b]OGG16648.1 MAG: hypothetical protein A3D78_07645 [Candidatus Gottesmanbacteria bacterium RIFCSPHIGHO2_02_FULL_39_14]
MSFSVGIVGLPNAGKSTLFNALASKRLSATAAHPFTTIDPHEASVPVPDDYLVKLSQLIKPPNSVPATVTFIDIAGLIKGAHKGEGLGNQFLAKIREVDAIIHVVRAFKDDNVPHPHRAELGTDDQIKDDIDIINLELELGGITGKKTIYVLNTGEMDLKSDHIFTLENEIKHQYQTEALVLSAKLEEELIDFNPEDKKAYLHELSVEKTGLENLIQKAYGILDLITFYTIKGGKEVRAWSLKKGSTARQAAGKVHTDFADNFIKAEIISVTDLLYLGGWNKAGQAGKIRLEGRDYLIQDKDVVEIKIGK